MKRVRNMTRTYSHGQSDLDKHQEKFEQFWSLIDLPIIAISLKKVFHAIEILGK